MGSQAIADIDFLSYPDDGDLLRALGAITYEAAHFERLIENFLRGMTALIPSLVFSRKVERAPIVDRLGYCAKWITTCYGGRPDLEIHTARFESFIELIGRRNAAVHGALFQEIGNPVMRYRTKHVLEDQATSSADMYALAMEFKVANMYVGTEAWLFLHTSSPSDQT
ncbi:hypothetical protein [Paraburkholderia aspalathi]|uniref:Apea-like HEPN domain-containing protein n=1 Tax=Paraburkholderia aspalathi TaxID=1324617 RepID=A0A1I7AD14_9BURK|nr:hypothetical protein [Paraburkholderia aspalathi]SFT72837.1 hypothetical protein SAMN05192563_1003281 [Paraburkholderia aspalathi]